MRGGGKFKKWKYVRFYMWSAATTDSVCYFHCILFFRGVEFSRFYALLPRYLWRNYRIIFSWWLWCLLVCWDEKRFEFFILSIYSSSVSSFSGPDESQSSATVVDSNEADIVSVNLNRARTIKLASFKRPGPPCCWHFICLVALWRIFDLKFEKLRHRNFMDTAARQ